MLANPGSEVSEQQTLEFLRERLVRALDRAAELNSTIENFQADAQRLGDALARAITRVQTGKPAAGLACAASLGAFDSSVVVLRNSQGQLHIAEQSGRVQLSSLHGNTAIAESFRSQRAIVRNQIARAVTFEEDRVFRDHQVRAYICVPASQGVVCLTSGQQVTTRTKTLLEAFMRQLSPWLALAAMEREKTSARRSFHQLALRLFDSIDNERGRIAGELHDEFAQLLTAARVTLATTHDRAKIRKAAAIFAQAEKGIRAKIRELSPVTLGKLTLFEALAFQTRRLEAAGTKVAVDLDEDVLQAAPSLRNLLYTVVREAISNLIKHARPKRVSIRIQVNSGAADSFIELSVAHHESLRTMVARRRPAPEGMGLAEIEKRVVLLGGEFSFDLLPAGSRLTARLPWV